MSQINLGSSTTSFIDALATFAKKSENGGKYSIIQSTKDNGTNTFRVASKVNLLSYVLLRLLIFVNMSAYTTKSMDKDQIKESAGLHINSNKQIDQNHHFQVHYLNLNGHVENDKLQTKLEEVGLLISGLKILGCTTKAKTSAELASNQLHRKLQPNPDNVYDSDSGNGSSVDGRDGRFSVDVFEERSKRDSLPLPDFDELGIKSKMDSSPLPDMDSSPLPDFNSSPLPDFDESDGRFNLPPREYMRQNPPVFWTPPATPTKTEQERYMDLLPDLKGLQ